MRRSAGYGLFLALSALPAAVSAETTSEASARLTALGASLEQDAAGEMRVVDLDSVWLTDADPALLRAFPQLRRLSLSHTRITDRGVAELRPLRTLVDLDLSFVERFTDAGVASLREMSELRRLVLRGTPVTSRALPAIARFTKLEELDLSYTHVSDENFDELLALTELRRLAVGGTLISGKALPLLRLLPKLEELDLGGVQRVDSGVWGFALSEANVDALAKLTQMTALDIGGATLTDSGLDRANRTAADRAEMPQIRKLAALVNLRKLDVSGLQASSADLRFLEGLPDLRELNLSGAENLDDTVGATLTALPRLEVLHMTGAAVGDATLAALSRSPSLRRLSIGGTNISAEAAAHFQKSRPDCTVTWFPRRDEPAGPEDEAGK